MKSEDIARYVAGLEEEVERLRVAPQLGLSAYGDTPLSYIRELEDKVADAQRERNDAQAQTVVLDNQRARAESEVRRLTALVKELSQQRDHWEGRAAVAEYLDAEAAAADTTPDTSRVTFGTRHEGTGMVLLQHADLPGQWFGTRSFEDYRWQRNMGRAPHLNRTAHAALAEVREALDTAEAAGVDVMDGAVWCDGCGFSDDDTVENVVIRACRFLAREVQALVDQGLRGDDLNARVPYEVRDHRAPIEAAETSSDDEDTPRYAAELAEVTQAVHDNEGAPWYVVAAAAIRTLDAHRAARTSGGGAA